MIPQVKPLNLTIIFPPFRLKLPLIDFVYFPMIVCVH